MLIDPHALEWQIPPKDALGWVEESTGLYLVEDISAKMLDRNRSYFPAEIPVLFHHFAATVPTREGVLAFARKFGLLGTSDYDAFDEHREDTGRGWEKFSNWKGEIEAIRVAYAFWRALKKEDEAALHATFSLSRFWGGRTSRFDIWQNAWRQINFITGDAFERYSLAFLPSFDFSNKTQHTGLSVKFAPSTLIMLIWLQFAQVASASDRWKICDHCGEPFKPESMKARYCSDSHRQMAYRKRKEAET